MPMNGSARSSSGDPKRTAQAAGLDTPGGMSEVTPSVCGSATPAAGGGKKKKGGKGGALWDGCFWHGPWGIWGGTDTSVGVGFMHTEPG